MPTPQRIAGGSERFGGGGTCSVRALREGCGKWALSLINLNPAFNRGLTNPMTCHSNAAAHIRQSVKTIWRKDHAPIL